MSDINQIMITGRCSRQPELKNTNGKDWCFLNLAINEYDFGTKKQKTTFVSVMCGAKLAGIVCDRVDKGAAVAVKGHLRVRPGDREKGTKDELGISADDVVFFAPPKPAEQEEPEADDPGIF